MDFEKIVLKPLSWSILSTLYIQKINGEEELKAEDIAKLSGFTTRQVDAAVTKSLVRYGFCVREAKLTRLMKKEYSVIKLTDRGRRYAEWYCSQLIKNEEGK